MKTGYIFSLILLAYSHCFAQDTLDKRTLRTLVLDLGNWKYFFDKIEFKDHNPFYDEHGNFIKDTILSGSTGWSLMNGMNEIRIEGNFPPDQLWEEYPPIDSDPGLWTGYLYDSIYYPKYRSYYLLDTIFADRLQEFAQSFLKMKFVENDKVIETLERTIITVVYPNKTVKQYQVHIWSSGFIDKIKSLPTATFVIIENHELKFEFGWFLL